MPAPLVFVHGRLELGGAEVLRATVVRELARRGAAFRVCLLEAPGPVEPDPYLVSSANTFEPAQRRSHVRAVS